MIDNTEGTVYCQECGGRVIHEIDEFDDDPEPPRRWNVFDDEPGRYGE